MKLTVACVVKEDTFWLEMMLKSALEFADEIIIVDDSDDYHYGKNVKMVEKLDVKKIIKHHSYHFGQHFGEGRKYAHSKATGNWIMFLDADEVIHENETSQLKSMIEFYDKSGVDCLHVEYIHFMNDFAHVDNSECLHIGVQRIYKNHPEVLFPKRNHSLPMYPFRKISLSPLKIWHLGYVRGMDKISERFHRNYRHSEMHIPIQQLRWRDWHYYGDYPKKKIDIKTIPKVIKETFGMLLGGGENESIDNR